MSDMLQLAFGVQLVAMDTGTIETTYIAHMLDGRQLQLSQQLYHLLKCLDRQRSLSELVDDFQQQTGQKISIEQLTQLLEQVVQPQGLLAGEQSLVKPVSAQPTSALALHLRRDVIPARLLQPLTRVLSVLFAPLVLVGLLPLIAVAHLSPGRRR